MIRLKSGIALVNAMEVAVSFLLGALVISISSAAWASNPAPRIVEPTNNAFEIWGYQPWWMAENWPYVDLGLWRRAIFFELPILADGRIGSSSVPTSRLAEMSSDALRCGSHLDIAFTLFDEAIFEQIFTSKVRRDTLFSEIAELAKRTNAQGVHLDFEIYKTVTPAAIAGFRNFVPKLKARLHLDSPTRLLSIFGVIGAAQDMVDKELLKSLDFVVIQGYDAHWIGSPVAGSVAPLKGGHALSWGKSLQHYLQLGAQRSRLLFSVPYFGYEWPTATKLPGSPTTGRGREMTYSPVPQEWVPKIGLSATEQSRRHGVLRDAETGSPYYVYQNAEGTWHQGWFEDETSLAEKFAFVRREKLAGIAAFPLGYDRNAFGALIGRSFGRRPYCTPPRKDAPPRP